MQQIGGAAPNRPVGFSTRINPAVRRALKVQAATDDLLIEDALHRALCAGLQRLDLIEQTPTALRDMQANAVA